MSKIRVLRHYLDPNLLTFTDSVETMNTWNMWRVRTDTEIALATSNKKPEEREWPLNYTLFLNTEKKAYKRYNSNVGSAKSLKIIDKIHYVLAEHLSSNHFPNDLTNLPCDIAINIFREIVLMRLLLRQLGLVNLIFFG